MTTSANASVSNFGEMKDKVPEWTADDEDIVSDIYHCTKILNDMIY